MQPESDDVALRPDVLSELGSRLAVPEYERHGLRPSVVHIGVGGFHRAHLAEYLDDLCAAGNRNWSIVGSGVLAADVTMAGALTRQSGLYCLITRGPESTDVKVIGSLVEYVHAHPDATTLIERIADPVTQMVSLTITEGGYPIDDLTGAYRPDSSVAGTHSTFGIIAAGLAARRARNVGPLSIVSCDNIQSNGRAARASTLGEAERLDPALARWIDAEVAFPNSMVDRITPATTDADRAWLLAETGIRDEWPVITEPFRQWVLEDTFAAERPPLEDVGVIMAADVEPYELMKLRLLNAGHSTLAYLAAMAGIEHVHTAMARPELRAYVRSFLDSEAHPALPEVPGIDLEAYKDSLIERFSNPAIADQIARLCLDGSAKFPKFLLPTVRAQLASGDSVALSALGLAAWCAYLNGVADDGSPIDLASDPDLTTAVRYADESRAEPRRFLEYREVFGEDLPASPAFVAAFSRALSSIRTMGVPSTIDSILGEPKGHDERHLD